MIGIDGNLRDCAAREMVRREIIGHPDFRQSAPRPCTAFRVQQLAGWLQLALRHNVDQLTNTPLKTWPGRASKAFPRDLRR
jgi:hypothetical protein